MTATPVSLEKRVAALEAEVAQLKQERGNAQVEVPWWEKIWGTFKDDPDYQEAMRLGREYRQAQRPAHEDETDVEAAA